MSETKFMSHNSQKQYDFKIKGYVAERISEAISSHSHSDLADQDDINQLKAYIDQSSDNIINQISKKTDTLRNAAGATITMSDSAKVPIQGLRLFGKTTQNGTPTPDAPVPLVSAGDGGSLGVTVAGKNLVPNDAGTVTNHGVTFTANDDGSVTLNGTSSGDWAANVRLSLKKYPAGKYLVSGCPKDRKGTNARIVVGSMDNSVSTVETGNGSTIEIAEETELYFDIRTALGDVFNGMIFYPMMRSAASTDATYEPYKPVQTLPVSTPNGLPGIPVTSGGNYTDETGQQWVCDEVDFGRGVYVQRVHRQVFNGSESWVNGSVFTGDAVRPFTALSVNIIMPPDAFSKAPAMCDSYNQKTPDETWYKAEGFAVNATHNRVLFYDSTITSISAWKTRLAAAPINCLFQLATPIETPLSAEELAAYTALHTNYPNTTILNDGGAGMEVKYCTPSTSVPMVHSEGDKGKILTIDEHGCVAKAVPGEFSAIDVDFGVSNEAEPSPINADTLGGRSADEYILKSQIPIEANYSVIGGITEPTNPTQNMIWVNTDIPIGRIFFGDNEPNETFIDGDVWIKTGISSNAAFNALRIGENYVNMVYPVSAKQYVNGAWVVVTAKSYQSGEWIDWWAGELYACGNEYELITGGWKAYAYTGHPFKRAPDTTKSETSITLSQPPQVWNGSANEQYAGSLITERPINLSDYSALEINVTERTDGGGLQLAVSRVKSTNLDVLAFVDLATGLQTLDISEITEPVYVCVIVGANSTKYTQTVTFDRIVAKR